MNDAIGPGYYFTDKDKDLFHTIAFSARRFIHCLAVFNRKSD